MCDPDASHARQARGAGEAGAERDPADMLSPTGEPGAKIDGVAGRKGKKAPRADGQGASGQPVDILSVIRPDPEAELFSDGVQPRFLML